MSDHIYENRQLALYHSYKEMGGTLPFEAFMDRHPRVNAYIVGLFKKWDGEEPEFTDSLPDPWTAAEDARDDYADAYANPKGGI